ncbi:glucosaminidase domain-containing protein [Carnobacteriaceae bacterium 52-44]
MQRKFRKFKNNMNRKFQKLLDRIALVLRIGIALTVIFFVVLFLIAKPSEIVSDYFINHAEQSKDESYMTEEEFIQLFTPIAKKVEKTHGTRPSLLIAQAALESNWGNSTLSIKSKNYFGIKGINGTQYATREYYDNEWESIQASFKHYDTVEDSIVDYANLIKNGTSWDADFYIEAIEATNYKDAAYAVQEAGYATDPNYADKLINIIEQYHLYEIDN